LHGGKLEKNPVPKKEKPRWPEFSSAAWQHCPAKKIEPHRSNAAEFFYADDSSRIVGNPYVFAAVEAESGKII
jgi:hypothetical protein